MACSSSASSASTSTAYGSVSTYTPYKWFSRTDSEIKSFQLLIKNFIQISSFKVGEKAYIDREKRTITVDLENRKYSWYCPWEKAPFYTAFIDILCRDLLRIMHESKKPIEKSVNGAKLTKSEAWRLQKAFIISNLIGKEDNEKKFQQGINNLKETYFQEPEIQKQLTALMKQWEKDLVSGSIAILKQRIEIEKILTLWNKILSESQAEERRKTGRFAFRTSLRSPAASSTPPPSQIPNSSKKSDETVIEKHSDSIMCVFEPCVKQLIVVPHKETVKQAGPSFIDTLRKKLAETDLNRATLLDEVERLRQKRIEEINRNSSPHFNNIILRKAQSRAPKVSVNHDNEGEDEFNISEPPRLLRSISQPFYSIADTKPPPKQEGSVLFKEEVKQALEKRFQSCLKSSDDSASTWSSDEETELDL